MLQTGNLSAIWSILLLYRYRSYVILNSVKVVPGFPAKKSPCAAGGPELIFCRLAGCLLAGLLLMPGSATAASFDDTVTGGAYHLDATWIGGSANPANGTADNVTINSSTVQIQNADDATNDTITLSSGGTLYAFNLVNALRGSTVNLNGGTLSLVSGAQPTVFAGAVRIVSGSTLKLQNGDNNRGYQFDSLTFTNGALLTVTNVDRITYFTALQLVLSNGGGIVTNVGGNPVNVSAVAISGSGTLHKRGATTLTLTGASSGFSGQVTIEQGQVTAQAADSVSGGTVVVKPGTTLATGATAYCLRGGTIRLWGGTLNLVYGDGHVVHGGNLSVESNALVKLSIDGANKSTTVDDLIISNGAVMTITNVPNYRALTLYTPTLTVGAGGGTVSPKAINTLRVTQTNAVELAETLTCTGAGNVTMEGVYYVKMTGSAAVVGTNTFTQVDATALGGTFTKSFTFNTANGLWSGDDGGAASVVTTIATTNAAMHISGRATFAEEDAGSVRITGLTAGKEAGLIVTLATSDADAVAEEMALNPAFTEVQPIRDDKVQVTFTPQFSGTGYFVWDNVANSLGANVICVSRVPTGTVLLVL